MAEGIGHPSSIRFSPLKCIHPCFANIQAWTTTNLLRSQLELENQIAKGLKFDLSTALNPAKSQKAAILTAIYKQPSLHTRATVDLFKVSQTPPIQARLS